MEWTATALNQWHNVRAVVREGCADTAQIVITAHARFMRVFLQVTLRLCVSTWPTRRQHAHRAQILMVQSVLSADALATSAHRGGYMQIAAKQWLAIVLLALPALLLAQDLRIELPPGEAAADSGYKSRWDSVQDRLIIYRGDVSVPSVPAVRLFAADGSSLPFYPLRDFPEARRMTIWSVAATPSGGVALAVIAEYGPRDVKPVPVKSLILTYDNLAKLRKVWEVKPYHHHQLAVDGVGNVFGLGNRGDVNSDYPLLIKYSPEGKILNQTLSSSLFPGVGDNVILSGSPKGESEMFVDRQTLYVWIAPTQELFRFSLAGELIGRASLAEALRGAAEQTGYDRPQVLWLGARSGKLVVQMRFWPKDTTQPVKVGIITMNEAGAQAKLLAPLDDGPRPGYFLGLSRDEKLMFVELEGKTAVVRRY